jgi:hypothetical protein
MAAKGQSKAACQQLLNAMSGLMATPNRQISLKAGAAELALLIQIVRQQIGCI